VVKKEMNETHYKEKLSEFVNHELTQDERQAVAEHLLQCAECRAEHDEIKLGASLASALKQTDAPENLWHRIENSLDGKAEKVSVFPNFAFFSLRGLVTAAFLLVVGLTAFYFAVLRSGSPEIAKNEPQTINTTMPRVISTPNELAANQNTNQTAQTNAINQTLPNANSKVPNQPQTADSNIKLPPIQPNETLPAQANLPSWNVETLAGTPKAGNQIIAENGKLMVGEFLETDANSKAKIQVANIGNVEIAPNSRVKLVDTKLTEHRLALEKGALKAKILAPPRLFIVDTPSAVAVDLGCEYTLEVDAAGNGRLHVTAGFVALERGGREVIVPAGAIALTRKGKGVGTPFSEDASAAFQNALYKFDFAGGGSAALNVIIKEASLYDSLTLWHLLSRTPKAERTKVFDALEAQIKPPANVTREGILRLDKKMLDAWWKEIETVWFE
jgi:cytoskeletal protein RodZ